MDDKDQQDTQNVDENSTEDVQSEEQLEGAVAEEKQERPERNYKAELDRKNKEIERLRQEADVRERNSTPRRDPSDITTWADHELKAVVKSNDPQFAAMRDQAEEVLFERKVKSIREKERVQEKRALSDLELRSKYPDALDPHSEFASKMEQIMYEYDLQKTPAGRLVAAKIAASELGKGRSNKSALERKNESSRVRELKGQMVDGDRSKPSETKNSPKKIEDIEKGLMAGKEGSVGDALKLKGIDRNSFFGRK